MSRLNPDDYCKACWKKVEEYVKGLDSGDVIAGKYIHKIREKYRRLLSQKDKYVYKVDQVDKVFKFFSLLNIEHKNSFVQIDLFPWQCFVLSYIFGFYLTDNPEKRLIREVLLFIARKAGKTAFAASIQLYGLLADGVLNAQSMLLANTAGQASVALNFAKAIVTHSPLLSLSSSPSSSSRHSKLTVDGVTVVYSSSRYHGPRTPCPVNALLAHTYQAVCPSATSKAGSVAWIICPAVKTTSTASPASP